MGAGARGQRPTALASYRAARAPAHLRHARAGRQRHGRSDWDHVRHEHPGRPHGDADDASMWSSTGSTLSRRSTAHRRTSWAQTACELPDRPYGLAAGDEVIFTAAMHRPGRAARRERHARPGRAHRSEEHHRSRSRPRARSRARCSSTPRSSGTCASAYAQHVYKAQGRTVDRSFVLTGGWQTDRERAYVALTRAKERTDIYISREDLGEQGMDAGAIERLGEAMSESNAQQPASPPPSKSQPPTATTEPKRLPPRGRAHRARRDPVVPSARMSRRPNTNPKVSGAGSATIPPTRPRPRPPGTREPRTDHYRRARKASTSSPRSARAKLHNHA